MNINVKENNDVKNIEVKNKIPLTKVFKLNKSKKIDYCYLKITPDITIGFEQKTYFLAKAIHSILQTKVKCVVQADDGSVYHLMENQIKVSYIIDLHEKVNFYFLCPKELKEVFKEKIYEVFKNTSITEIDDLDIIEKEEIKIENIDEKKNKFKNVIKKQNNNFNIDVNSLELKYNDAISLNVDNRLYALEDMILNHYWLGEKDRITIIFNFTKTTDKKFNIYKQECLRRIKNREPMVNFLNNKVNSEFILQKFNLLTADFVNLIFDISTSLLSGKLNDKIEGFSEDRKPNPLDLVSLYTREKFASPIIETEILVISKSDDYKKRKFNLKNVTDTFAILNDDNQLVSKRIKCPTDLKSKNLGGRKNLLSLSEISKFLILPHNEMLSENENIEQIKTRQNKPADFVRAGNFYLGEHNFRGDITKIYLPSDYNSESLAYVLIAPQGGGKTTFITNLAVNAYLKKQANIFIDYIKDCESSKEVERHIDKKDLYIIDAEDIKTLPRIDFNEYDISKCKSEEDIGKAISAKIDATESIIDTINEEQPLTANMSDILSQCCQIVYSLPNTNFGNVIDFITDYEYRINMVEKAKKIKYKDVVLNKKLEEAIQKVDTINEYGRGEDSDLVVGTLSSKVNGIMARISQLKKSYLLYNMVYNPKCQNVDFIDLVEKGKTILVKLPEHSVTPSEKNVISTFITMKTILSTKRRGGLHEQPPRANLWIDEVYQVKTVENVIHKHLSQLRKYGLKVNLTVHRMSQLNNKKFKDELLSSGASFTLIRGCKEIQVKDFLDRFKNGFKEEDIYNLKPFHAFHFIDSKHGEWQGITALPRPLKES